MTGRGNCTGLNCKHTMHPRCPGCKAEIYMPRVFAFSHGEVPCTAGCLYIVNPNDSRPGAK